MNNIFFTVLIVRIFDDNIFYSITTTLFLSAIDSLINIAYIGGVIIYNTVLKLIKLN